MSLRRKGDPSVIKSGLAHFALSCAVFAGLAGLAATAIILVGDEADAGPNYQVAVFEAPADDVSPQLKSRFAERELADLQIASFQPAYRNELSGNTEEPTLSDANPIATQRVIQSTASVSEPASESERTGIRINGRTVYPGEAFSEIDALGSLPKSPLAGLHSGGRSGRLPIVAEDGRVIADAYARPYYARNGQPTISLVLGGLGINYTHTLSAINELPPEVTLSFAPHARGLQTWIRRARDAGHEVLIELPLEPHTHGRLRPHTNMLEADLDPASNTANLERILTLGHGYFGVINYQGDKFATSEDAVRTLFEVLKSRGVAFVEDGSIVGDSLQRAAAEAGAPYARADLVIDARMDADAMRGQLSALEALSRENGGALGTAIGYPLTIDIIKEWTEQLDSKGLVLAPASSLQSAPLAVQADTIVPLPEEAVNLP